MKLPIAEEKEVRQVYDTWLKSYLNGDIKVYDSYLDPEYRFIGSTDNEEFLNKKDTTNFLKATADQLAGKAEVRNSVKTVEKLGDLVFITELFDAYFLNDAEWAYYGRFRFTSTLQKKKNGWRFVYQHFSMPDAKAQEGETLGTEQISKENQELRDAIKRRTVELEQKNRDLEIEASLERVRARSLAMQSSDELLDASDTMFAELEKLSIDALRIGICTIDGKTGAAEIWSRSENKKSKESKILGVVPKGTHPVFDDMFKAWKAQKASFSNTRKGLAVKAYYEKVSEYLSYPLPKKYNKEESITAFFFPEGSLNVVSLQPLGKKDHEIMLRFAKVFGQIYQRFLDLQKAEAQVREAQIEAALERVRARTMAMQRSEDLQDTALLLFQQVEGLGVPPFACGFNIWDADGKTATAWMGSVVGLQPPFKTDNAKDIYLPIHAAAHRGESLLVLEQAGEDLAAHYAYLATIPTFRDIILKNLEREGVSIPTFQIIHCAFFSQGYLMFISYEPVTAFHDVFKRFATVFEQTYTRFLDLQKAEAQTREAEIELALERVRAKTMAMQKSEELRELVFEYYKQIHPFGFAKWGFEIKIAKEDKSGFYCWNSPPGARVQPEGFNIPTLNHWVLKKYWSAYEQQIPITSIVNSGADKRKLAVLLLEKSDMKNLPEDVKTNIMQTEYVHFSVAAMRFGLLKAVDMEPVLEKDSSILQRFAKVFEQTYTRFLDLQKAEAQAREAQVEAALERVRSRTMAMQKSEDLIETAADMFQQIQSLGRQPWGCGFNIFDKDEKAVTQYMSAGGMLPPFRTPLTEDPFFISIYEARQRKEDFLVMESKEESLAATYRYMFSLPGTGEIFENLQNSGFEMPKFQITHCAYFSQGYLMFITFEPEPESHDIFKRYAKVFEQTYTRFLDLQKAEAQAREAQIETALEKVRTRTMAMQKGEELQEVAVLLYKELLALGVTNFVTCGYVEINEEMERQFTWVTAPGGDTLGLFYLPLTGDATFDERYAAWKRQQGIFHQTVAGEKRTNHLEYAITTFNSKEAEEMVRGQFPDPCVFYCFNFSHGYLHLVTGSKLKEEEESLLARFTRVFEQTYARFLDLKKAEAQAREAQIENALEKVRSRTMAMQKSHELPEAANNLFLQVQELGIPAWSAGYCIWETEDKKAASCNMSSEGEIQRSFILPTIGEGYNFYDPQKKGETFYIEELGGDALVKHYEFMRTLPKVGEILEELINAGLSLPTFQIFHILYFPHGYLMFITYEQVPEAHDIFKRFAKVFEQTYTRFLDLQKAEAQAREAQIEAALEKVRSRSLAMHKSDELKEVVAVVLEKLQELNIAMESRVAVIVVFKEGSTDFNQWVASPTDIANTYISTPYIEHIILSDFWKAKKSGLDFYSKSYSKDEKNTYFKYFFENSFFENFEGIEDQKKWALEKEFYTYSPAFEKNSSLGIADFSGEPLSENEIAIIKRFAKVFEQAYIRFLDLQKAEAQAREAHIESALERVRARSMAMHKSEELAELSLELVKQVQALGVATWFCAFNIYDDDPKGSLEWGSNGQGTFPRYRTPREGIFLRYYEAGQKGETLLVNEIGENECAVHYEYLCSLPGVGDQLLKMKDAGIPFPASQIDHVAYFRYGYILFITYEPVPESHDIFKRFARVFEQTYTRFLDLKNVEAQTRSAQIETALERVRARALAMQDPEELTEVAEVLRYEMGLLGVEELETSSIYINDEENEKTECWYALKDIRSDGKKLVSDHFPLDLKDTWVGREMQKFYASVKKQVSIVMKGEERKEWIDYCAKHSGSLKGYYGEEIPDRTYHLFKFSHGAIGAASAGEISGESWDLLKRAASVFSLAYSRFKDLTQARIDLERLKEEKKRAEEALRELQITQAQLIQSEKMASLGELTAGIAHEIQNPLNFVNNFSEVSVELIEEMNEELEKGDLEEAMAIIRDIRQNLAKINHHGKRADGIVKGMLQHSRSSSGVKEPTDLNALCDEYLRLAYHGLRAKDKSFNATMNTDFDPKIGTVDVVPQDMGRVILNLITNAFYAVNEKSAAAKASEEDYEPTVWVSTKRLPPPLGVGGGGGTVEISVRDNGNGIPEKVKEKIFQPFFTTKPTGQGTGLGLSLSYDIVKAHGGTLQCSSTENTGTEFVIELPLN